MMTMSFDISPLWISLKTAVAATFVTLVLGILIAYRLAGCTGIWKRILDGILTLPMVLPPTVVGYFLLLLFGKNGPLGSLLARIGVVIVFSWMATVIAAVVVSFPLMYKTILVSMEQIDQSLIEAAEIFGATRWQTFFRIILPLAWPGILAGIMLSFARALGEFGATIMIAGGIPGRTQTIPLAIFFAAETGDMNTALIWVLIVSALSMALMYALNGIKCESVCRT